MLETGEIQGQLDKILASPAFRRSRRLSQFLQFTVERTVSGRADEIKEQLIGAEVFERGSDFDPQVDTIVRTQAHRLRAALSAYYEKEGLLDGIRIDFEKGSYVPAIRESVVAAVAPISEVRRVRYSKVEIVLGVALLLALGVGAWAWLRPNPAQPASLAHLSLPLYSPGVLNTGMGPAIISPSGRSVVFPLVENTGGRRLWLRSLSSMNATGLAGTEDGYHPFWSPDESEIGFFANGMLKVFRLSDGSVRNLCEAPLGRGGTWNRDGIILFTPRAAAAVVYRTTSAGKPAVAMTTLDAGRGETDHRWPEFLSDGRHFVYTVHSRTTGNDGVYMGSLDGAVPVRLEPTLSQARHAETQKGEYLLFVKGEEIRARKLNVAAQRLEGGEVTLAHGVSYLPSTGASFSVVSGQYLVYNTANSQETVPVVFDRNGKIIRNLAIGGNALGLALSRDGKGLAAEMAPGEQNETDIWAGDSERAAFLRVTMDGGAQAVWGHDGRSLIYVFPGDNFTTLFSRTLRQDRSLQEKQAIWKSQYSMFPTDVSRDGRFLAMHMINPGSQMDLLLLPLDPATGKSAGDPIPVRRSRYNESQGYFSADGDHIAYASDESGHSEVYVETIAPGKIGEGLRSMVSAGGGFHPRWRQDGSELFYLSLDRVLMSVPVSKSGGELKFGTPRKLFATQAIAGENRSPYGVSPDGKSFYFLVRPAKSGINQVALLTGWMALLR